MKCACSCEWVQSGVHIVFSFDSLFGLKLLSGLSGGSGEKHSGRRTPVFIAYKRDGHVLLLESYGCLTKKVAEGHPMFLSA